MNARCDPRSGAPHYRRASSLTRWTQPRECWPARAFCQAQAKIGGRLVIGSYCFLDRDFLPVWTEKTWVLQLTPVRNFIRDAKLARFPKHRCDFPLNVKCIVTPSLFKQFFWIRVMRHRPLELTECADDVTTSTLGHSDFDRLAILILKVHHFADLVYCQGTNCCFAADQTNEEFLMLMNSFPNLC